MNCLLKANGIRICSSRSGVNLERLPGIRCYTTLNTDLNLIYLKSYIVHTWSVFPEPDSHEIILAILHGYIMLVSKTLMVLEHSPMHAQNENNDMIV